MKHYNVRLECDVSVDDHLPEAERQLEAVRQAHAWMQDNIHRATVTVTSEDGNESQVELYELVN